MYPARIRYSLLCVRETSYKLKYKTNISGSKAEARQLAENQYEMDLRIANYGVKCEHYWCSHEGTLKTAGVIEGLLMALNVNTVLREG